MKASHHYPPPYSLPAPPPHGEGNFTNAESRLGLECAGGGSLSGHKGWCTARLHLSSAFLYSSLTNTSLDKKDSYVIIHSVINFVLYSINIHWESTLCQVRRAIAPIHLHKTNLVFFWLQTFPGAERAPHLCLSKSFPFHKIQSVFIFTLIGDPWALLHELILNSFLLLWSPVSLMFDHLYDF